MHKRFFLSLLWLLIASVLFAEERTALVIGNSAYEFDRLRNPVNDAEDVARALQEAGFTVELLKDAGLDEMLDAVDGFWDRLQERGGVGLFYYAGHGVQMEGKNYLIPIGADIQRPFHLKSRAYDVDEVLAAMQDARNETNIIILDACRNFPKQFVGSGRELERGLAVVGYQPPDSIIVYATSADSTASDGEGRNGIFTEALLEHIGTEGLEIRMMLSRVRRDVMAATGNEQVPAEYTKLINEFYFAEGGREFQAYGTVKVEVRSGGVLYLDGERQGRIAEGGTASIKDVASGRHEIELRYEDGQRETKRITVPEGRALTATFSYTEEPAVPEGFVLVEAGSFQMGSTEGDSDERPVHTVRLTRSFYLGIHEVTNREVVEVYNWALSRGKIRATGSTVVSAEGEERELLDLDDGDSQIDYGNGSLKVKGGKGDYPCIEVSWYGAVAYSNYLSEKEGLQPSYEMNGWRWNSGVDGYRLPTEAEWEYAARGGKESRGFKYAGSNSAAEVGWYNANSGDKTHPVGQKIPNELGIYDMSGNVWEWCWDWYASDYYAESPGPNPSGPSAGEDRVLRGGSWSFSAFSLRVADRSGDRPTGSNFDGGFRLARTGP